MGILFTGEWAFALLPILVVARQTVEFLRQNDTPGRDLGDHITGYVVGIAVWGATQLVLRTIG